MFCYLCEPVLQAMQHVCLNGQSRAAAPCILKFMARLPLTQAIWVHDRHDLGVRSCQACLQDLALLEALARADSISNMLALR